MVTRERRPQAELLRLGRTDAGWVPDPKRALPGRGAYVAIDRSEILDVKKLRRFARAEAEVLAERLRAFVEANPGKLPGVGG